MVTAEQFLARQVKAPSNQPLDKGWYDALVGPILYGATDTSSNIAQGIGRYTPGDDPIERFGNYLDYVNRNHPEWAPERVNSVWELVSNPLALYGAVASNLAYMGTTLGAYAGATFLGAPAAVGMAGIFGIAFLVEGQNAYEDAKANGASEEQARLMANSYGAIAGLIEVPQVVGISKLFRGFTRVANLESAAAKLYTKSILSGLSPVPRAMLKEMGIQSLQEMSQGGIEEALAHGIYAKPFEGGLSGFANRRAMEAVVASVSTLAIGGISSQFGSDTAPADIAKPQTAYQTPDEKLHQLYGFWRNRGYTSDQAQANMTQLRADIGILAKAEGVSFDDYIQNRMTLENPEDLAIYQSRTTVRHRLQQAMEGLKNKPEGVTQVDYLKANGFEDMAQFRDHAKALEELDNLEGGSVLAKDGKFTTLNWSQEGDNITIANRNENADMELLVNFAALKKGKTLTIDGTKINIPETRSSFFLTNGVAGLKMTDDGKMLFSNFMQQDARSNYDNLVKFALANIDTPELVKEKGKPKSKWSKQDWNEVIGQFHDYAQSGIAPNLSRIGAFQKIYGAVNDLARKAPLVKTTTLKPDVVTKFFTSDEVSYKIDGQSTEVDLAKARDPLHANLTKSSRTFYVNPSDSSLLSTLNLFGQSSLQLFGDKLLVSGTKEGTQTEILLKSSPEIGLVPLEILEPISSEPITKWRIGTEIVSWEEPRIDSKSSKSGAFLDFYGMVGDLKPETQQQIDLVRKLSTEYARVLNELAQVTGVKESDKSTASTYDRASGTLDAEDKAWNLAVQAGLKSIFVKGRKSFISTADFALSSEQRARLEAIRTSDLSQEEQLVALGKAYKEIALDKITNASSLTKEMKIVAREALRILPSSFFVQPIQIDATQRLNSSGKILGPSNTLGSFNSLTSTITLFNIADPTTFIHELGHAFHEFSLTSEYVDKFRAIYAETPNAKKHAELVAQNEAGGLTEKQIYEHEVNSYDEWFAEEFKDYMLSKLKQNPKSNRALARLFDSMKDFLYKIYQGVMARVELPAQRLLEQFFAEERAKVGESGLAYDKLEGLLKASKQQKEALDIAQAELQRLAEAQLDPNNPEQGKVWDDYYTYEMAKKEEFTPSHSMISSMMDSIRPYWNIMGVIQKIPAGRVLAEKADQIVSFKKTRTGPLYNLLIEDIRHLGSVAKWLHKVDANGITNQRKLVEAEFRDQEFNQEYNALSPTQKLRLEKHLATVNAVQKAAGSEAEFMGALRQGQSGATIPWKVGDIKLPRIWMPDIWAVLKQGRGNKIYDALVDSISRLNPEMKLEDIHVKLRDSYSDVNVRKVGMLESTRSIKVMPDAVRVDGKWINVLHSNPFELLTRAAELQFSRLGFIKAFGQPLGRIETKQAKALFKAIKLPYPRQKKADLAQRIAEKLGLDAEAVLAMNGEAFKSIAKQAGVETNLELAKTLLKNLQWRNFDEKIQTRVRSIAKKMRGIDHQQELFSDVWKDVLVRLDTYVPDQLAKIKELFIQQGGDEKLFDAATTLLQGLPLKILPRNALTRAWKFFANVNAGLQTSLAGVPNMLQPLQLLPATGGLNNLSQAYIDYSLSPEQTLAQDTAMGAFRKSFVQNDYEQGYLPEFLSGFLRQGISKVTMMEVTTNRNNALAAQVGLRFLEGLRTHGIKPSDERTLRRLRLNEAEIASIKSNQITEHIRNKVVQNMVSITQFVTEDPVRRGLIENGPFINTLIAYFNYTAGQTRAMGQIVPEIFRLARGSASEKLEAAGRAVKLIGGMAGAGMAGEIMLQAIKGRPIPLPDEDDDIRDSRFVQGLIQVQFFGAMNRAIQPFQYDDGMLMNSAMGFMPHVKALTDYISALIPGYGRYRDFSFDQRMEKVFTTYTPLARATLNQLENLSFPEKIRYEMVRQKVPFDRSKFSGPPSSKYADLKNAAIRNDFELGYRAMAEIVNESLGSEVPVDIEMIYRSARSSLSGSRPLPFSDPSKLMLHLSKLRPEEQALALQRQMLFMQFMDMVTPK